VCLEMTVVDVLEEEEVRRWWREENNDNGGGERTVKNKIGR